MTIHVRSPRTRCACPCRAGISIASSWSVPVGVRKCIRLIACHTTRTWRAGCRLCVFRACMLADRFGQGLRRVRLRRHGLRRVRLRALAARHGLQRGLGVRFEFRDRALPATTVQQRAPSRSDRAVEALFFGARRRLIPQNLIRRAPRGDDQKLRSHQRHQSRPS